MGEVRAIDRWPSNAELIADCARLGFLRDEWVTLDATHGRGTFWKAWRPDALITADLFTPAAVTADFTALPFMDRAFDAVVFDPPYKLNGTPSDPDERYGVAEATRWQDRMALIRTGARECARVSNGMLLVKCQDQVVSGKIRWQTRAVADEVEPQGFGLVARFDFLGGRAQPEGRRQVNPRSCSSQLLVFRRGWYWSDL